MLVMLVPELRFLEQGADLRRSLLGVMERTLGPKETSDSRLQIPVITVFLTLSVFYEQHLA